MKNIFPKVTAIFYVIMSIALVVGCGQKNQSNETNISNNTQKETASIAETESDTQRKNQEETSSEIESQTEESKTEEPKTEEPKTEESKTEEPKTEEPKTEESKTEEPKTEEPKTEESKTEEPKTEEPKTEEPKTEEPKTEPQTEAGGNNLDNYTSLNEKAGYLYNTYYDYLVDVLNETNKIRSEVGAAPLVLDEALSKAACGRACEMVENNYFSHLRPNGNSCFTILDEFDIGDYDTSGENIAAGYRSPELVVQGWKESQGHYKNMIKSNYKKLGVGYCKSSSYRYGNCWVQLFTN